MKSLIKSGVQFDNVYENYRDNSAELADSIVRNSNPLKAIKVRLNAEKIAKDKVDHLNAKITERRKKEK